jgi:hypothetical protein
MSDAPDDSNLAALAAREMYPLADEKTWSFPKEHAAKQPEQVPCVGRVVHYVSTAYGAHCAAIITRVYDDGRRAYVTLAVFDDGRTDESPVMIRRGIRHDETAKAPGSWHWPERV